MDDWELSAEDLDSLERDALKQLAERNQSCAAATTSHSSHSRPTPSPLPAIVPSSRSPAKPTFLSRPHLNSDKVAFFSFSCFWLYEILKNLDFVANSSTKLKAKTLCL